MIGYTCRLSAGHDGPCDFRTAEQVRADEFRAARLVPDPFVVIYGAGSAYAAEHRRQPKRPLEDAVARRWMDHGLEDNDHG